MLWELGDIQNPVYYSFLGEDRKIKDDKQLAKTIIDRVNYLYRGKFYRIDVYDNQTGGKPLLFSFKPEEI